jgi:uncharacterized protein YbcV (DUF1398 family)
MQLSEEVIHQIEEDKALSYPEYVQKLKEFGVAFYEVRINERCRKFTSKSGQELLLTAGLPNVICAEEFNPEAVKSALDRTQKGLTDYPSFLKEIAAAGVHSYIADLEAMKIAYRGIKPSDLYTEVIPNIG